MKRTALTRRKAIRRTSPMKRGRKLSRYAKRPRDTEFMLWVKTLLCSVEEERPCADLEPEPCAGPVEADHAGARGLGQKCSDRECIPLCSAHHRQRTDHSGTFKHVSREDERAWRSRAIARTQAMWAERL